MNKPAGKRFYIFLTIFIILVLFPFYWQLITSFKLPRDISSGYNLIPETWTFRNYVEVFTARPFGMYILNSFAVGMLTTIYAVVIGSMAGYAIARLKFRGKSILLGSVLGVAMFPQIAIISPIYLLVTNLGIRNTWLGLIIPYTVLTVPLAVWNLSTFFKGIPDSLEEAAKVDGATPFQAFVHVILPLAAPGAFTTAIIVFIAAFNEYLFALTINTADTARTVPVGISMFQGRYTVPWGEIAAATVIVTVPLVIVILLFQKRIVSGLTQGAVKG